MSLGQDESDEAAAFLHFRMMPVISAGVHVSGMMRGRIS